MHAQQTSEYKPQTSRLSATRSRVSQKHQYMHMHVLYVMIYIMNIIIVLIINWAFQWPNISMIQKPYKKVMG